MILYPVILTGLNHATLVILLYIITGSAHIAVPVYGVTLILIATHMDSGVSPVCAPAFLMLSMLVTPQQTVGSK